MANLDLGTTGDFVDKRLGRGNTGTDVTAEAANYRNVTALRTRLAALNAGYYTTARLETMTENDMVYALRQASADSAGI